MTATIESTALPTFTFLGSGGEGQTLDLSDSGSYVLPLSQHLSTTCERGAIVGIMAKPGPALVLNWLAAIHAGLRPLIMQYPTPKQSAAYWEDSVRNTIDVAGVGVILADDVTATRLSVVDRLITQREIEDVVATCTGGARDYRIGDYAIVQLSSGTTGHRKATEFTSTALARHVADYNRTLDLTPGRDVIVSWLPLYHDMGYVACFVMPMLLGLPVVMMDPIDWVADPAMLYRAIEQYRGTICYMPNFGYEVMSRQEPTDLSSMRWWVSCSEPVSAITARKFLATIGADERVFAPCYAMAENIFAMTIRRGIAEREVNGADAMSCGAPIAGVELKIVDDQIWVRSPTSIGAYMNGTAIVDADGFYPTGDLGEIHDGELYVAGRKQDLIIQAGRKFMLSDIDLVLNRLRPEVKGRGVAVQFYDDRLGTNVALVLIEAQDFLWREDADDIADEVSRATDIDQLQVAFVPPRFLTKTSSGKFNRKKSAADWLLHKKSVGVRGGSTDRALDELKSSFARAAWDQPVGDILDSLSLTVLRIILGDVGVGYDKRRTLDDYAAAVGEKAQAIGEQAPEVIHIVSLADRNTTRAIKPRHLERLERVFGRKVTFEHICLPPSPVLLSDLIFADYFGPRLEPEAMSAVDRAVSILRSASIIILDDVAEFYFSPHQVYGTLSHNLERDRRADQISIRWQRYGKLHHDLPVTVVTGADLSYAVRAETIRGLVKYLGKPVFRIATVKSFAQYTRKWEYRNFDGPNAETGDIADPVALIRAITAWVRRNDITPPVSSRHMESAVTSDDLAHFCSHFIDATPMDRVIASYDRFCVVGQASSIPYLTNRLDELGKSYTRTPSFAKEIVAPIEADIDVIVACGAQGRLHSEKPFFGFMKAGGGLAAATNVTDPALKKLRFFQDDLPASNTDWYFPYPFDRTTDHETFKTARQANHARKKDDTRNRAKRRERRAGRT